MDRSAVRKSIFDSYTFVSNLIDIAGDGDLPPSADPFEAVTLGVYIQIADGLGTRKLRWSDVKDVLWGLRQYMVVEGYMFEIVFLIKEGLEAADVLGFGRVGQAPSSG